MDIHYGGKRVVRAKLKAKIINISLKASDNFSKEVELFDIVQNISSKIQAARGASMLEVDEEYITLVSNHLSIEVRVEWKKSKKSEWSDFYLFLEERAKLAKSLLTDESILADISAAALEVCLYILSSVAILQSLMASSITPNILTKSGS